MAEVNIAKVVGGSYKEFWFSRKRYVVVKGSRASKKSKTTALWIIYNMLKMPKANTLVVRNTYASLKDSCYADLQWACEQLKVKHLFEFKQNPLEIRVRNTGQKILFRGLDTPDNITSLSVPVGYLCWSWFEEAYLVNEEAFNKVDLSLRGVPDPYFVRHNITFNPWSENWLKDRFFDIEDDDVLAMTTTYRNNDFLDEKTIELFKKIELTNPRRARVECFGEFGISEGLIFENWRVEEFDKNAHEFRELQLINGLDWGYTNDPTAFINVLVDEKNMRLYIFDEHYKRGMLNTDIANMIKYKGYSKSRIIADSAENKSIDELKRLGITKIQGASKGKDSVMQGIQRLQQFEIIVHPTCENTIIEFSNYAYAKDKKTGKPVNKPIDDFNHLIDALRYAIQILDKGAVKVLNKSALRL